MDSKGVERERLEGYLPKIEFRAQLELGLARVAFMNKQWADAERRYAEVVERHPKSIAAAEAIYWKAVSHYKGTNDHSPLGHAAEELNRNYPGSIWALRASVWSPQ
jgi:outer membrane protein assembly factor BamD (BamD/ComL family)